MNNSKHYKLSLLLVPFLLIVCTEKSSSKAKEKVAITFIQQPFLRFSYDENGEINGYYFKNEVIATTIIEFETGHFLSKDEINEISKNRLNYNVEGIVDKEFSNCICNQENQIINLKSGKSTICPILKIDNYNVDSNHSAYIGRFSEEKLFYMMSRGLTKKDSYRLLLNGFLLNSDSLDASKIVEFTKEINII